MFSAQYIDFSQDTVLGRKTPIPPKLLPTLENIVEASNQAKVICIDFLYFGKIKKCGHYSEQIPQYTKVKAN